MRNVLSSGHGIGLYALLSLTNRQPLAIRVLKPLHDRPRRRCAPRKSCCAAGWCAESPRALGRRGSARAGHVDGADAVVWALLEQDEKILILRKE